ncbi:MAG: prepilin-type N-terminal cleavage/methylation domain-containing protein [Lachnospiraceae bacterium]|nr:prepilin-type N-terminal cleavage/methylation domain-containing protein [Lachnospiraceae bacterium]
MREDRKRNGNSGFTLVEVLLAVAILAIISIPLMQSFVSAARVNGESRRRLAANTIAETLMESCKSVSLADIAQQFDAAQGPANNHITIITESNGGVFSGNAYELKPDLSGTMSSYTTSLASSTKYAFLLTNISSGGGRYCALIQYELDSSGRNHGAESSVGSSLNGIGIKYMKYYNVKISVYRTTANATTFIGLHASNTKKDALVTIEGSVTDRIN